MIPEKNKRVLCPESSVQSAASRAQRPDSSVQSPAPNTCVQSPGILVRHKTVTTAHPSEQLAEIDHEWKLSDYNEFLDVKQLEGKQVPAAIKNIGELEESDEKQIGDSDNEQSNYKHY